MPTPRVVSNALDAVKGIESGDYIWCHSMAATPYRLLEGLAEHALSKKDITILQLHTERSEMLTEPHLKGHIRHRCYFVGNATRPLLIEAMPTMYRYFCQKYLSYFAEKNNE